MRAASCLVLTVLLLAGCANTSLMTPYPVRAGAYTHALGTGMLDPALAETRKIRDGRDALLARLEEGRLAQLQGDTAASRRAFAEAERLIRQEESRALVSAGATAAQGLALLSNDNAIPYRGAGHEQVFLHTYQALNYVAAGDREGALVEMRRAQGIQDRERERKPEEPVDSPPLTTDAAAHYAGQMGNLEALAARTGSSVQNAWSLYLAGVLYEADGKPDDAFIDYKRALGLAPGHGVLRQDLARLAARLGRRGDAEALGLPAPRPAGEHEGDLVVLFEEGTAPPRQELFLPFPWPEAWYVLAIPYYPQDWQPPVPLKLEAPALKKTVSTVPLTDVQALAARELKERMPGLLLRQTLRAQAKHKLQQEGRDKGGDVLGMLIGAWNLVSEQADLRGWLTLPRFAHIARLTLPAGEHTLRLDGVGTVSLNINRRRITLLRVVRVDNRLYTAAWPL